MINNNSTLSATFEECGNHLVSRGHYSRAKVQVQNGFNIGGKEVVKVLEQSRTIEEPVFKSATKNTIMSFEFIKMALEKPRAPKGKLHWWLKSDEGKISQKWGKISDEDKIQFRLEQMAHDQGMKLLTFEVL